MSLLKYSDEKLCNIYDKGMFKNELKYIQSLSTKDIDLSMKDFVKYTNTVDKVRGQSFEQSCPQEWDLVKEYFYGSE